MNLTRQELLTQGRIQFEVFQGDVVQSHIDTSLQLLPKLLEYASQKFGFQTVLEEFSSRKKNKHSSYDWQLLGVLSAFFSGATSLSQISRKVKHPGTGIPVTRKRLELMLSDPNVCETIASLVSNAPKKMSAQKMLSFKGFRGKSVVSVDGTEIGRKKHPSRNAFEQAVQKGEVHELCNVAVHNYGTEQEYYETYLRLVVVTALTERGAIPIAFSFQNSDFGKDYANWLDRKLVLQKSGSEKEMAAHEALRPSTKSHAAQKSKQEGELTTVKKILKMRGPNGRLKWDVVVGDGLYCVGPFIDFVEKQGAAVIASMPDERRNLIQRAGDDYNESEPETWKSEKRIYIANITVLDDPNREEGGDVKIIKVTRKEKGKTVECHFYTSKRSFISPQFVERCRAARWDQEDLFNHVKNRGCRLNHIYHNDSNAIRSITGLILYATIVLFNFRKGWLKRGKPANRNLANSQWKEFLEIVSHSFRCLGSLRLAIKSILESFDNSKATAPPLPSADD